MEKLTDFNKQCIYECYSLLRDCVAEKIANKGHVATAFRKVEQYRITLPSDLYERIYNFMRENISPIIENPDFFSAIYSPEYGNYNDDGDFVVNSEESLNKQFLTLVSISIDLENKIDAFAMEYMRPYLI